MTTGTGGKGELAQTKRERGCVAGAVPNIVVRSKSFP
jgi:hypothetical protein